MQSTFYNTISCIEDAIHASYISKSPPQRLKPEVAEAWSNRKQLCTDLKLLLLSYAYRVGNYRHFVFNDGKKPRNISVLPFADRCTQNAMKEGVEPSLVRMMTDDMTGGLRHRGVLSRTRRYSVIDRMKREMNNRKWKYTLQGDLSKFYDNCDNVTIMRLLESQITSHKTLSLIRQHLFNQKELAIGDPLSHLISNVVASVIARAAKKAFGKTISIIFYADDFIAFSDSKQRLRELGHLLRCTAKSIRCHYKPFSLRPIKASTSIVFCGIKYGRGWTKLTKNLKKNIINNRHKRRSMASYKGILSRCDTKNFIRKVIMTDNRIDKISRRFAGKLMKIDVLTDIKHTITDFDIKKSKQDDSSEYARVQLIADGLGLVTYHTGSLKIVTYIKMLQAKGVTPPLRDMNIVRDYSGFYYEGTVCTDAEEMELLKARLNL